MFRCFSLTLLTAMLVLSVGGFAQDPKAKDDPKKPDPVGKMKGRLPAHWSKLGLSEKQVQDVYKVQTKYGDEIDKLEAKIKELKAAKDKEEKAILTPDQKKRLEDILLGKDK